MTDFTNLLLNGAEPSRSFSARPAGLAERDIAEMVEEASAHFRGLYDRLDVRVVILRANGRAFSAGADLG